MNVQFHDVDLEWRHVGTIDEIPVLGARCVKSGELTVAVFRTSEDQVFALEDKCPHKDGPLSQGIVHGTAITCPLHAWNIDLATGEAIAPDVGCVRTFDVKQVGADLFIKVESGGAVTEKAEPVDA